MIRRGGRLGLFIAVFFGTHPDAIFTDLGAQATKNGYIIPSWYSSPAVGDWPEEWRQMHPSNPERFGMGPLSVPLDWPCIDLNLIVTDFNNTVQDHFRDIFAGTSKSGELFCFTGMRWIYALLHGAVPTLNRPDLGWGIKEHSSLGSDILDVPEIPLRFNGGGSYEDPWRIPLISLDEGSIDFTLWLGPDGPPSSFLASTMPSMSPPPLEEILQSTSIPIGSGSVGPSELQSLVDALYHVSQFSPKFRAAIGGRPKEDLLQSIEELDTWWSESDGQTLLSDQIDENNWDDATWSITTQTLPSIGSAGDSITSPNVIPSVVEYLETLGTSPSRIILLHSPWQSPFSWYSMIENIDASPSLPFSLSVDFFDHIVVHSNDNPMSSSSISSSNILILQLEDASNWNDDSVFALKSLLDSLNSLSENAIVISHSLSAEILRHSDISSHSSLSSAISIAPANVGSSLSLHGNGWQDAIHVFRSLGINMKTGGG